MRKKYTKGNVTLNELLSNTTKTEDGCLEWLGSTARNGYGQVRRNGKLVTVTRLIMHFFEDFDLTSKLCVLHHCDNPRCVNIDHLYTGTVKDNVRDKVSRDRHNRGRRVWKAKLEDSDIKQIFELRKQGWSGHRIGRHFKIAPSSIYRILQRKAWKHVKINQRQMPHNKE